MAINYKAAKIGLAMSAAVLSTLAVAQDRDTSQDHGWYIGGNIGESKLKVDEQSIIRRMLQPGVTSTQLNREDRDEAFKTFGGYQMNRYWALESGYFDLGKFTFSTLTAPPGTMNGSLRVQGVSFDLVGTLPLTEKLSAIGRIGAAYQKTQDSFGGTGAGIPRYSSNVKHDTNEKWGAGLQYAFNSRLAMRAEYERYRINDAIGSKGDVELISVGLIYRFGARRSAPVQQAYVAPAPAPVYVAPAPAPAPVVVAPPVEQPTRIVMPQARRVSFSADSLFDFDKSTVKPGGREHLDKFARELSGTSYSVITVTGHADRLGSAAYNRKLSAARAESVKNYLVTSGGIPAAGITTSSAGETQPITKPGECVGKAATKALIACLQPDRRVDVEVVGSK